MKLTDKGQGDFEQPDAGSYAAVCIGSVDIGTQAGEWQGKPTHKRQVILRWELDEKMADGQPFTMGAFYTASLSEKAKLRSHLEAWRGAPFTAIELEGFDTKNLLGKPCLLSLIKNASGKVKVGGVSKLPKGMAAPTAVNPIVYFSLDEFDKAVFDSLTEGVKKLIVQSPEYQKAAGATPPAGEGAGSDEEVPF